MLVWAVVAQGALTLHVRFAIGPVRIQAKAILASKEIAEAEIVDRLCCRLGDLIHRSRSLHIYRHDEPLVGRTTRTEVGGYQETRDWGWRIKGCAGRFGAARHL